ncbi:hypothetical protein ACQWF0_24615, partial [Salmonella enterica subsp. enterica serovar Infantis]
MVSADGLIDKADGEPYYSVQNTAEDMKYSGINAELTDHPGHENNAPRKALIPTMAIRQKC